MAFAANYCHQLQSLGTTTLVTVNNLTHIPKDTNLHQQRCTILNCRKPTLYRTVSSSHSHSLHILLLIFALVIMGGVVSPAILMVAFFALS